MARVKCEVSQREITNESGREIEGVAVTCGRCEHEEESFGTGEGSIKRCLALLRENCPRDEHNFYVVDE